MNKQETDSREPGGKQDQDTGDLFFISTSLTRCPLQVLLRGLQRWTRAFPPPRQTRQNLKLFQILIQVLTALRPKIWRCGTPATVNKFDWMLFNLYIISEPLGAVRTMFGAGCMIQKFVWIFIEETFPFPKCCHVRWLSSLRADELCSRTDLSIGYSISVPSDIAWLAEKKCASLLRISAMTTTTRFPLFKVFTVNPAVGKCAGWIRSEILMIFLFFTSLIGLLRAEINWFQWDDRVMNDGDADHLCSSL